MMADQDTTYDYVIVGGGSAGCVLAERLSSDPAIRVALVEAGPGGWDPFVTMPRAWIALAGKRRWLYPVEDSPGRTQEDWRRGRGLGGSSAVNGMIYCRGHPADYDGWGRFGVRGWGWSTMERAFQAIEDSQSDPDPGRGHGGPLAVSTRRLEPPLEAAVFRAAQAMGLKRLDSLNGPEREGVGYYDHTISLRGVRSSADRAFLVPAAKRTNLSIITNTHIDRIVFRDRRATAVTGRRGEHQVTIKAAREVLVCAGALASPHLLQRSGIGPPAVLSAAGVGVIHANPAVGANMGEHLVLALPHQLRGLAGHNREFRGARLLGNVAKYYLARRGVLTYGASEIGGFLRSKPQLPRPDLQIAMSPYSFDRRSRTGLPKPEHRPGFTIIGYMLHPEARGSVMLRPESPTAPPRIDPNWLGTESDVQTAVAMMRVMRAFVRQPGLDALVGEELAPGAAVKEFDEMLTALRSQFVSGLHAVGTCRMGEDRDAVVDERLRVNGVSGLRVVDASVIPEPPTGNTNGPVMALAWRASELIREA